MIIKRVKGYLNEVGGKHTGKFVHKKKRFKRYLNEVGRKQW